MRSTTVMTFGSYDPTVTQNVPQAGLSFCFSELIFEPLDNKKSQVILIQRNNCHSNQVFSVVNIEYYVGTATFTSIVLSSTNVVIS